MRQAELDWKPCSKLETKFTYTKLSRGDENSHESFKPVKFEKVITRGPKKKSDEQIKAEQVAAYEKKEAKLLITDV